MSNHHIEIYFNEFFIEINKSVEDMKKELKKLLDSIQKLLEIYDKLKSKINIYQQFFNYLGDKTQFKKNDYYKDVCEIYNIFREQKFKVKDNIDSVEKLNKTIDLKYNEFINFDFIPDSSINISDYIQKDQNNNSNNNRSKTPSFIENYFNENNINENLNGDNERNKCSLCQKQKPVVYSKKGKAYYCESCLNFYIDNNNNSINLDDDIINLSDITYKNNENKNLFLKSIDILIKNILMRCNYILNNEELVFIMGGNNQIKILDYPNIKNENNDCFNFLKQLYSISNDINHRMFNVIKWNEELNTIITNINKSIKVSNVEFKIDDDNDNDDSEGSFDENNVQNESLHTFGSKYFYFSVNSTIKSSSETDIKNKLTTFFVQNLNINNEDIFLSFNLYDKIIFVDNFIKTKKILNLSCDEIKKLYPNLEELYEFKDIFDSLIKECNIKDYIDERGNFIIQNKKETIEEYYPPYEWIGIGLKVLGKYEDDNWLLDNSKNNEWAIAYHGVGGKLSINEVKNKLEKKIKEGLKQGKSQRQCNLYDSRHPGKRIGTGVYLTPDINKVEDFSGIIQINKKRYRVALMSKVKIDKIRQKENINIWILNPKYIRIYRILLKKI